ncbi:hypothetical protein C8R47DRAFT_543190 [Mycena vitilis]|nr:hypothetical protein C8R47DRAFT_543190 [Mycena vitilis]
MSSSPAKRFADETRAQASNATHASTPADLALQLRSVGSRVRKTVTEGYLHTQLRSAPSSPTKSAIFTSANDILRDVYASAPANPPISPKKRLRAEREEDSDHDSGDSMVVDRTRGDDTESDGETVIILDSRGARPVKPRPRRPLMHQGLNSDVFGLSEGPLFDQNVAVVSEQGSEPADSSANNSTSSQPPHLEPMVL